MPRGDKSSYSAKQKRQAQHIEDSEEKMGRSAKRSKQIAWATVNKQDGGAKGKSRSSEKSSPGRSASSKRSTSRSGGQKKSMSRGRS